MYSESIETLVTKERLAEALETYRNHPDYAKVKRAVESGSLLSAIIGGTYTPGASLEHDIPKHDGGKRTLSVSPLNDRIVAKAVVGALSPHFPFSDRSYAYRPNKGPVRAIRRVLDEMRRDNTWVLRSDIEAFFDSIEHDTLLAALHRNIEDPRIVTLLALFVKKGSMRSNRYKDHFEGIHQGDPLSPFLANLYLDPLDRRLEERDIPFVRYGDDLILMGKNRKQIDDWLSALRRWLENLHLRLNESKTRIGSLLYGFEYLGLYIHQHTIRIERNRFDRKANALRYDTRRLDLYRTIELFNERIVGFNRYYGKLLTDLSQLHALQETVDTVLVEKISAARQSGLVTRQALFINALEGLASYLHDDPKKSMAHYRGVVRRAYETLRSTKDPQKAAKEKIERKKRQILQSTFKSSELVLGRPGLYLGFTRGKATIKEKGKVIKTLPIQRLERIVVLQKCAISSEIVRQCAHRNIAIDFIYRQLPYAMLVPYRSLADTLARKQMEGMGTRKFVAKGRDMIRAKIRNQANLLQYHARYRREKNPERYEALRRIVKKLREKLHRFDNLHDAETIRGIEGSCGVLYWEGFGILIGDEKFHRVTRDAPDAVNQALNYGYAILYHRIQSALLQAGLDIYTPLFHAPAKNRPTLVFDCIEEFRQPVVDREIVAMLNHGKKLTVRKGRLGTESVEAVTTAIQSRLATPTLYKGEKHRLADIVTMQARALAASIKKETRYHPFVAKY
ncbi:CRISPR-associated endonuclease Cas1 [Hydrogenimonas sp.]